MLAVYEAQNPLTSQERLQLIGLTANAFAQLKAEEPKKLPEVVIEAEKDTPTQITIKVDQIQNRLAVDIDDLFAGNPQVLVGGGIPAAQKIYVGGFEDKLLNISIDGATQAGYLTHHQSQFIIVPELMKQVTVSAGPGAATNGPGTLAGSIRLEHKSAFDFLKEGQDFGMFLKSGYHSNGDGFQQTAAIYGRISENWSALAAFTYFDVGDYKDGNGNVVPLTAHTQRTGFLRVDGQLTEEQKLTLTYERVEDDAVYFHRSNFAGFFAHPRASNIPVANNSLRDTATLKYELDPDGQLLDLKATLFYSNYRIDRETQYELGVESLGFDLRNTSKIGRHAITYGMDYRRDFTEFTGKGRSVGFALPITYTTAPDEVLGILGVYFQDEWQVLDPLTLSFGLRYDSYEFTDFLGQKFGDSGYSPNMGVTWQVTQPLALYARYAQSFRGVTPIDSITRSEGGTTNRAGTHGETAHNVDGGFRYDDGTFFGTGSVFHQAIDSAIVTSGATRGNGGRIESWGYFAEVGARHDSLETRFSVSQSFPRFNGSALSDVDFGFGTATGRAWRASVDYTYQPWRLACGYELSYVEGFDAVPAGISGKAPYCVSNLYANWKPLKTQELTLQLAVTNLFDRFYVDQTTSGYNANLARTAGLPAQGLSVRLAVSYQFKHNLMRFFVPCFLSLLSLTVHAAPLTDVTGRVVELEKPASRVLLGEGRFLSAIALLERDAPAAKIAGLLGDFPLVDPDGYRHFVTAFPAVAEVPTFGRITENTVSVESLVALLPEVAVFGLGGHGPAAHSKETVDKLTAAGVKVVFIAFRSDPLVNTPKSMRILGRVFGREKEAEEFAAFYEAELAKVSSRIKDVKKRPTVFIENRVGLSDECCGTMAHGMMGRFIDFAGGENIANTLIPGEFGTLSLEHLLTAQPEVYIGTAIGSKDAAQSQPLRIQLGTAAAETEARESLRRALSRTGINQLTAIQNGRAHAIWHHYHNSPLNVVAVQIFAKWLHPDLFIDLKPEDTLKEMHKRFQELPQAGVFWISLESR